MPQKIQSKTGNAPVKQVGHTTGQKFGTNVNAQVKGSSGTRDLKI